MLHDHEWAVEADLNQGRAGLLSGMREIAVDAVGSRPDMQFDDEGDLKDGETRERLEGILDELIEHRQLLARAA